MYAEYGVTGSNGWKVFHQNTLQDRKCGILSLKRNSVCVIARSSYTFFVSLIFIVPVSVANRINPE